jgi:hypothetical protein
MAGAKMGKANDAILRAKFKVEIALAAYFE